MARKAVGDTYGAAQATIEDWANRLRSFAGSAGTTMAQRMVPVIHGALAEAANSNRSVMGETWKPTKRGNKPLAGVMSAVTVKAIDSVVLITMTGYHVFHEFGARGTPARRLLPHGGIPDRIGNLIRKGYLAMAEEWLTRKGRHDTKASAKGMGGAIKGIKGFTPGGGK